MALTGIQIFKFLPAAKKEPNTNCKKCGFSTCMAFAMKLAKNEVDVYSCPFMDENLKQTLLQENKKPQVLIEIGKTNPIKIGDENVMFRHDKTFVNPTAFAIQLFSNQDDFDKKLNEILNYKIERVGKEYKIDAIELINNGDMFLNHAKKILKQNIPTILTTNKLSNLKDLTQEIETYKPLIYLKSQNIDELAAIAQTTPVIVDGKSETELVEKTCALTKLGIKNIVLKLQMDIDSNIIEPLTMIRRSAIEEKLELLGFPIMISYELSTNIALDTIKLSSLICKYTNLISINILDKALLTSLITLRLNIYTDPQKPLQVEPKLYEIGNVNENSKVIVTTNFALTYFAVVNELECLTDGVYLIITNSDGMSVLTAWSATKFTGEIIAKAIKNSGIETKVNHKNIIIPGLVADLKAELEDELPEYNVIVGTNEATDLPEFLTNC